MPNKIQFKRGLKAALPDLDAGEPGYCTDTQELFVGNSTGSNKKVVMSGELVLNVKDYGAKGNGSTDDTSAIQATMNDCYNAGGGIVYFPPGTYIINETGISGKNKVSLIGSGRDVSIIKVKTGVTINSTNNVIQYLDNVNDFVIRDFTIDLNNVAYTGLPSAIGIRLGDRFEIRDLLIKNYVYFGINLNSCTNFKISDNTIDLPVARSSQNQAILLSQTVGASSNGVIERNHCIRSAMDLSGFNIIVEKNIIHDFKFGAGIVTEQDVNSNRYIITKNTIFGGTGTDANAFVCPGIENWGEASEITGNIIYANDGNGIDQGGKKSVVANNIIYNNGNVSGSGITNRYGNATYNASESIIVNNRIYDTRGANATQRYGIEDQSANTNYVTISGNNLKGNKTAPMKILGTVYNIVPLTISGSIVWSPPSIAVGAAAENSLTVPGATLGDYVTVSCSASIQSMRLFGYVNATNIVVIRIENGTGGAVALASATYRVIVSKPFDAEDY